MIHSNFSFDLESELIAALDSFRTIAIGVPGRNFMELDFIKVMSFVPYAREGIHLAKAIVKIKDSSN